MELTDYIKDCIKRIEKTYNSKVIFTKELIKEIIAFDEISSGCEFMDWLNKKLYLIMETEIDYKNYEDLDNDDDNENFCCRCENFVKENLDCGYCRKCSIAVYEECKED